MSDSSDDDEDVCDNYRIDMTHATFGTCKCGKPKSAHTVTTKAGANAKKIVSSLEGKLPAGGRVTSGWQPRPQASLLQKKAAAEESEVRANRTSCAILTPKQASHSLQNSPRLQFWKKQKAADEKNSAAVTSSSTFAERRAAAERAGAVSQAPVAVAEQFRRQRRASVAAVEDAAVRKQEEVAQQQAAEQAKTAEAAGAAAAAEAFAAEDEAASTAALLAQVKQPRSSLASPPPPHAHVHARASPTPFLTCRLGAKLGPTYRSSPSCGGWGVKRDIYTPRSHALERPGRSRRCVARTRRSRQPSVPRLPGRRRGRGRRTRRRRSCSS